jgi:hypothetical protein
MRSFSDIPIPKVLCQIDPDPESAKAYLRSTISQHLELYDRSMDRWGLRTQESRRLNQLLGRQSPHANQLASNMPLREGLGCLIIDAFSDMMSRRPHRRYFSVTLISDRWLAFDRDTYVWLGGMRQSIRPVMALGCFDGWFAMLEVQTLDETVRGLGRILLPHAHAIAWSDDPEFSPENAVTVMTKSHRLVSRLGAPTVEIRYFDNTNPRNLAAYLFKAASVAKFREPCMRSPSGLHLADTALPPGSAVRQSEVLSGMYFDELMLTGGDGAYLRTKAKQFCRDWIAKSKGWEISAESAETTWLRTRRRTGRDDNYAPVSVVRETRQLPYHSPISLAAARFTEKLLN